MIILFSGSKNVWHTQYLATLYRTLLRIKKRLGPLNVIQFPAAAIDCTFINWKVCIDVSCFPVFYFWILLFSNLSMPGLLGHMGVFVDTLQ